MPLKLTPKKLNNKYPKGNGMKLIITFIVLCATSLTYAATDYRDIGRCYGVLDVYVSKGNQLTPGNSRWVNKHPGYTPIFKDIYSKLERCRTPDPKSPALHEKCAKSLPNNEFQLYEGRLAGIQSAMTAINNGDKSKLGVLVMSCSE